jgi:glucose-1-phosphate adenylyltransferase
VPDGISIGKNSVVAGVTTYEDYENNYLPSGRALLKAGGEK